MSKKILCVDDSSTIRKLVEFSLKSRGYIVMTAEDGQNALELLAGSHFDSIILDINMPRLDGFEFLKRIKANDAYTSIPVIMLTTEGQEEDRKAAMALGAFDYIVKPFKPSELIGLIDRLFE